MILAAAAVAAAMLAAPRFFIAGDGTVALVNAHSGERATVIYRRADGSYDPEALAKIRRVMRSRDGGEGEISLRLIELLGHVYRMRGKAPLTIQSGYRSPDYNERLRARGARAAGGSLHTEGLAADVVFAKKDLRGLWLALRDLECCGVGFYQGEGFLHLDVGRPRFWEPATSKVEQNLSAGNAKLFARTEFDRYLAGEPVVVTLHALTAPPVRIATEATLVEGERTHPIRVEAPLTERGGCVEVAERTVRLRVTDVPDTTRGRIVLRTCPPRVERTPEAVETNAVEVRRGQ